MRSRLRDGFAAVTQVLRFLGISVVAVNPPTLSFPTAHGNEALSLDPFLWLPLPQSAFRQRLVAWRLRRLSRDGLEERPPRRLHPQQPNHRDGRWLRHIGPEPATPRHTERLPHWAPQPGRRPAVYRDESYRGHESPRQSPHLAIP